MSLYILPRAGGLDQSMILVVYVLRAATWACSLYTKNTYVCKMQHLTSQHLFLFHVVKDFISMIKEENIDFIDRIQLGSIYLNVN